MISDQPKTPSMPDHEQPTNPRRLTRGKPHRLSPLILAWPGVGIALLVAAATIPWLGVSLIVERESWSLAIDFGWGRFLSYGVLVIVLAVACVVMVVMAWRGIGPWQMWSPRRRLFRLLIALGMCSICVTALFLFQWLLVDFHLVGDLAAQQNEGLLIRSHLGYRITGLIVPMKAFNVATVSLGDRFGLLLQTLRPGPVLPLVSSLFFFYGAYLARPSEADLPAHQEDDVRPFTRVDAWRLGLVVALGVGVVVVLGRAPVGLLLRQRGIAATQRGDYASALSTFALALNFAPGLDASADFHRERGQATYLSGKENLDTGLYVASQLRINGALQAAWVEDTRWYQQFPRNELMTQDLTITLEWLSEKNTVVALTPPDEEAAQEDPEIPIKVNKIDNALQWVSQLLVLHPDSPYAHYLRGRTYFTTHSYEEAATDFQAVIAESTDDDMLSAGYTYLAFCRAGVGDYAGERVLLKKAMEFDHGYYNTTAREAASGLQ